MDMTRLKGSTSASPPLAHEGPPALRIDGDAMREILPQLIDAMADAVVVLDARRRVVAANRRYVEAFGVRRRDMIGEGCRDALGCPEALDGTPEGRCSACLAIESGTTVRQVRTVTSPGGARRHWEATFNPVAGPEGHTGHVIEVWRDITDRSHLEAQLAHSERLAALGGLAAGVAHEINNPLASVLASVESMQRWLRRTTMDDAGRAEADAVLNACEREIARVRETSDKLMLLAQPQSVKPAQVDLERVVQDTLSLVAHQMRAQAVTGEVLLAGDLPLIWAREGAIRGICMNLIQNAVQAMPGGGALLVATRREDDRVVLEVADSGEGIPDEIAEKIWDPFFTTKPPGKGTGLGLSITRGQVEHHGGTVRAGTRPGGGACFVVELPIHGSGG
jgi:PAS domain S-box-containing protein